MPSEHDECAICGGAMDQPWSTGKGEQPAGENYFEPSENRLKRIREYWAPRAAKNEVPAGLILQLLDELAAALARVEILQKALTLACLELEAVDSWSPDPLPSPGYREAILLRRAKNEIEEGNDAAN